MGKGLSFSPPHTPHSSVWLLLSTQITSVPAHGTHKQLPLLVPSEENCSLLIKANHNLPNSVEISLQKELGSKRVADKVHQSHQKRRDIKLLKKHPTPFSKSSSYYCLSRPFRRPCLLLLFQSSANVPHLQGSLHILDPTNTCLFQPEGTLVWYLFYCL